jgi:hypothetical protein
MSLTTTISGGQVQLTGNPVLIKLSGGTAPAGASQYKYLLRIISQDNKLYGAPFVDAIAPDASGNATFDISGLVNQPISPVFQYPPVGTYKSYPTQALTFRYSKVKNILIQMVMIRKIGEPLPMYFKCLKVACPIAKSLPCVMLEIHSTPFMYRQVNG